MTNNVVTILPALTATASDDSAGLYANSAPDSVNERDFPFATSDSQAVQFAKE